VSTILVARIYKKLRPREILPAGSLNHTLHYAIHDRKYAPVAHYWAIGDGPEVIGIPYTK
jgi:hypothetical protein